MSLHKGSLNIAEVYKGSAEIASVYKGNDLIWEKIRSMVPVPFDTTYSFGSDVRHIYCTENLIFVCDRGQGKVVAINKRTANTVYTVINAPFGITSDGTYIYVTSYDTYIRRYTFDESGNLTAAGNFNTQHNYLCHMHYYDGALYCCSSSDGLIRISNLTGNTFNPTASVFITKRHADSDAGAFSDFNIDENDNLFIIEGGGLDGNYWRPSSYLQKYSISDISNPSFISEIKLADYGTLGNPNCICGDENSNLIIMTNTDNKESGYVKSNWANGIDIYDKNLNILLKDGPLTEPELQDKYLCSCFACHFDKYSKKVRYVIHYSGDLSKCKLVTLPATASIISLGNSNANS